MDAHSSPSVTALRATDRNATMWLTLDLMAAIERQVAARAVVIDKGGEAKDAGARDAARSDVRRFRA